MTADQVKKQLGNHKWSILVAFIMLVMVGFGYKLARIVDEGQSRQLQAHKESIAILSEENNALITQVNQLEVALVLAKGETQELVKRLAEQRKEFDAQQELLTFYERVVAPEKSEEILAIEGVELSALDQNRFQLRMVLLQSREQKAVINGNLSVAIKGQIDGKSVTLHSSNDELGLEDIKYRFRFFQAVTVELSLPQNFTPQDISFSTTVYQYKTRKSAYDVAFPWNDVLNTGLE